MKKNILSLFIILIFGTACDKDFVEINTNPTAATDIDPKLLFSTSLLEGSANPFQVEGAMLAYASCFVQHFSTLQFNWQGDKYFYDTFHNDVMFNDAYRSEVKTIVDIIDKVKDDPESQNLYAAARIWKVLIFHRLTDLYGDIPYFEAGKGFLEGNFKPAYDAQEDIYRDMLAELEAATASLDNTQPFVGAADFIYNGDIDKWRRFGNTMMLRLALRMTKVDIEAAESWAKKAIAGGVMTNLNESTIINHSDGDLLLQNGIGYVFANEDNQRLSEVFVDWMKSNEDPRLPILSYVVSGDEHKGLPHGTDDNLLTETIGEFDLDSYSRLNPIFSQRNNPTLFLSYAEAELMQAEAALRGWGDGDAKQHFELGVAAALQHLTLLAADAQIMEADIAAYIDGLDFSVENMEQAMEMIHSQYWAATFLNELEAYSNWRRTGYPKLTPANFPGNVTNGVTPRRLRYPQKEYAVNADNLEVAIARQGKDAFVTRVWWDK